jgi:hypothetical protein
VHAVFPSRRGLVPSVGAFLEFLAAEVPPMLAGASALYEGSAEELLRTPHGTNVRNPSVGASIRAE